MVLAVQPKKPFQPLRLVVWKRPLLERDGHLIVEHVLDVVDGLCVEDAAMSGHILEPGLEGMRTGNVGHRKARLIGGLVSVVSVLCASHGRTRIESGAVLEECRELEDRPGIPRRRRNLIKLAVRP